MLRSAHPYRSFADALAVLGRNERPADGVHPTAVVAPDARLGQGVSIGPFVVVGAGAQLGDRVVLHPHVVLGPGVRVGEDSVLHARVSVRERSVLGRRVVVQDGAVIGSDGYGYVTDPDGVHHKIPQHSVVVIDDDVEIGANTTIDRPAVGETRIGRGTKIDNLVQIAHGVKVGEHALLVAQVGIAGSSKIGDHVVLAGQVGVAGHITIGDRARATAQSGIPNSIDAWGDGVGLPGHRQPRLAQVVGGIPEPARTSAAGEGPAGAAGGARSASEAGRGALSPRIVDQSQSSIPGLPVIIDPMRFLLSRRATGLVFALAACVARARSGGSARGGAAAKARLQDHDPRQRAHGDPLGGPFDADRARGALVPRRVEGRAARAHRLRAPVRAHDVQGLEERRAGGARLVHRQRRRPGQRRDATKTSRSTGRRLRRSICR